MACRGQAAILLLLMVDMGAGGLWRQTRSEGRLQQENVSLAVILPESNTNYPWAWPRVGPAIQRAVRTVNDDPNLLPGHTLTYVFKSSEDKGGICSESTASLMAVDLKLDHNPWAFIGPGCSYTSSPVGLFTTHWDIPMVTAGAAAVAIYGTTYTSVTNTGPTHKKLGRFALRICQEFGWRDRVMLLFSDKKSDDRPYYFAAEGLYEELSSFNITTVNQVLEDNNQFINYSQILSVIQNEARSESGCSLGGWVVDDGGVTRCRGERPPYGKTKWP